MHRIIEGWVRPWRRSAPKAPKLKDVLRRYATLASVDPDTVARNVRVFRLFLDQHGNVRSDRVTRQMAAEFLAALKASGKSTATIRSYRGSVSSVFGWAMQCCEGVTVNPMRGVKAPKLERTAPTYWSRAEMDRLYQAIESLAWREPVQRLQWRALLMVADQCGLRIGEIVNLRWDDLDLEDAVLRVAYRPCVPGQCWEWGTKGHRDRTLPLGDELLALLGRLAVACPWHYPFLPQRRCHFLQGRADRLSPGVRKRPYTNLYEVWKRIRRRAQIAGDGAFHRVRRTAATELAERLTSAQLKAAFGWQQIATAEHYIGVRQHAQLAAVRQAQAGRDAGAGT